MVECGGLENRYGPFWSIEGSNPSPSPPAKPNLALLAGCAHQGPRYSRSPKRETRTGCLTTARALAVNKGPLGWGVPRAYPVVGDAKQSRAMSDALLPQPGGFEGFTTRPMRLRRRIFRRQSAT